MRVSPPLVLVVSLFVLTPGVPADAARCPMARDVAGDVRDVKPSIGIPDPTLDIRSADIAGNKTSFAVELRVHGKDLEQPDLASPGGRIYFVVADVGTGAASSGPFIGFQFILDAAGRVWDFAAARFTNPDRVPVTQENLADAAGYKVENKDGKIRVWATYDMFDATGVEVRPGIRVRRLWAFTARWVTAVPHAVEADSASVSLSYRFGDRGCIPIGR